ncbi:protein CASP-like [Cloeon dipterum]|uniref:protein CASP-like n=1 Tax=Cloeon dipterum TaxID=197152 RepID=UPI0032202B9E
MMDRWFEEPREANLTVFFEDIRNGLLAMDAWKKRIASMEKELQDLQKAKEEAEKTTAEALETERAQRDTVLKLTGDFEKLQMSLQTTINIKAMNVKLNEKVRESEKLIKDLKKKLENEREENKRVMQKTCTEIANQANKQLLASEAQAEHLKEQLSHTQEQLRKTTSEYQTKLRNADLARKEDLRQMVYDHQEKINDLQAELNSTRDHCRELQEKLRTDALNFQKKIKEAEKSANTNPFTRAPVARRAKPMGRPQLDFVNGTPPEAEQAPPPEQRAPVKKRKLFVPSDLDDDFL